MIGLIVGATFTGMTLALIVKKKHYDTNDSNIFRYILSWFSMNTMILFLTVLMNFYIESKISGSSYFSEAMEFLSDFLFRNKTFILGVITAIIAALISAAAGYISHTRHHKEMSPSLSNNHKSEN
jgi:hypothetical protein